MSWKTTSQNYAKINNTKMVKETKSYGTESTNTNEQHVTQLPRSPGIQNNSLLYQNDSKTNMSGQKCTHSK